ncbi:MAG TPA: twin-arginine translocation signal domain-containing protein, partial [Deltaproteobacteria bacterium]|nr:twin-arginine translocation signal domain-containing protein [Deltaproteobacteria bacterium]
MEDRVIASGFTRREFMKASLAGCTLLALSPAVIPAGASAQTKGPFDLPPLPYDEDALAPVISAGTIGFHYGKHHRGYLDNLNGLVKGTPYEKMSLEDVIRASASGTGQRGVFNNAAQVWNHTFYWNGM